MIDTRRARRANLERPIRDFIKTGETFSVTDPVFPPGLSLELRVNFADGEDEAKDAAMEASGDTATGAGAGAGAGDGAGAGAGAEAAAGAGAKVAAAAAAGAGGASAEADDAVAAADGDDVAMAGDGDAA